MTHSAEQMRKKAEAMRESEHHKEHSAVHGDAPRRWKSKTEMMAEDMVSEGKKMGLDMEIDRG